MTDAESTVTSCQYTTDNGSIWNSGIVSGSASPWTCTGYASALTGSVNINVRGTSAGGTGTGTAVPRTVDSAAPTTTASASGYTFTNWTATSPINVTLSAVDSGGAGVAASNPVYCTGATDTCSPATVYSAAVPVTCAAGSTCTTYVRYRATDNVNNTETTKSSQVRQDRQGPTDGASLTATPIAPTQIDLSWSLASDSGSGLHATASYKLVRATGATAPADCSGTAVYSGMSASYSDTGRTQNTQYSYRVCAYDAMNNVSAGRTASATTPSASDVTPPTAGTVNVTPSAGTLPVYTSAAPTVTTSFTDNESTVTACEYTTNGSTWSAGVVSGTSPTWTCTATPSGLSGSLTINMRATSTGGTGTATSVARTADSTVPSEGVTFTVTAADARQINLSWSTATDAGAGLDATAPYKVVRAAGSTPPANCSGAAVYAGTATSFNDAGLPGNTQYSYRMCVYDGVGNSSAGKTGTASTNPILAVYPLDAWTTISTSAPNNISGTIGAGNLTVSAADDRMFLAGVCLETAANATMTTMNVTLGGTALTQIASTGTTSARSHCYVGRLMNASIPAGSAALSVQYALSTSTVTAIDIKWASFYGVSQASPVNGSNALYNAAATVTFGTAIDYTLGGLTTYVTQNGGSAATHTPPSGFTSLAATTTSGHSTFAANTANHASAGSYASGTTVTFGGTSANWSAVAVASLNRTTCTEPATVAVDEPVPNPIITTYSLSATGTSGATNIEVSADNTNWYASPWLYTPPFGTGSVTFYARATGACGGSITDATPVTTSYNSDQTYEITTCADCHAQPPVDGARNADTRAVVGSHNVHATIEAMPCTDCHVDNGTAPTGLSHLNLNIEMVSGSTALKGGFYDKNNNAVYNAGTDNIFAMSDNPTLGTCATTDCHYSTSPTWGTSSALTCSGCHGYPPTGGTTGITHIIAPDVTFDELLADHQDCITCHMTKDDGAGNHSNYGTYTEAANHINGQIEMNTTVSYNQTNFGCDAACHGNDAAHQFSNSGLTVNLMAGPAGGTDCNSCHGNPPTSGAHLLHVVTPRDNTVTQDRTDCANCHTGADAYVATASGNHRNSTVDVAQGWNGTNCATNTCHSSTAGDGFWTDTALDCTSCHGNPPTSGKHTIHAGASAVACGDCHSVPGAGDTAHITDRSGATTGAIFTGMAQELADEATIVTTTWNDTNNTCANTQCHNPSAGGTKVADWDTGTSSCTLCHENSSTIPSGSHNAHLTSDTLFGRVSVCNDCHPATSANNHMNLAVNYAAGMNYAATRCTTTTCHNDGTGTYTVAVQTPTWGTASANCTICHAGTPATGAHTIHVNAPLAIAACTSCHTAETATTHINSTRNMAASVTYTSASGTCNSVSGCHNNTGLADWRDNSPTPACVDCHAATYVAAANGPTTGLHNMAQAGVTAHNQTLTGGCAACHNTTIPGTHRDGSWTADSASNTDRFISRTNMTWTDAAANTSTCSGTGLTTPCHSDGGTWTRLWSTAADSTATAEGSARCAVCHGEYGSWRTGTIHASESTKGSSNHGASGDCTQCHVIGDAAYVFSTKHENGAITINSNASTPTRSGGKTWCAGCHTNDVAYNFNTSTAFVVALDQLSGPAFPINNCDSCHAYPPVPGDGKANQDSPINEGKGAHAVHVNKLAVLNSITYPLDPAAGQTAGFGLGMNATVCGVCHTNTSGEHGTGNGTGTRVITMTAAYQFDPTTNGGAGVGIPSYGGVPGTSSSVNFKSCSNVNCHFGSSPGWLDPAAAGP